MKKQGEANSLPLHESLCGDVVMFYTDSFIWS